jgi:ketosteroid isomerase-like protein
MGFPAAQGLLNNIPLAGDCIISSQAPMIPTGQATITGQCMFDNPEGIRAAENLSHAIASLDAAVFAEIYAENAVIWHNTTNQIQTKTQNAAFLGKIFDIVKELAYYDITRRATPDGFVQYHTVKGFFKDGTPLPDLHACIVAKVADGKIVELHEFLDASHFQAVWDKMAEAS